MRVVTHGRGAHFDEFAACCLIMGHKGTALQVSRREPLDAELADPDVWVIDTGSRHEPTLNNFDHHQDLRELPASFMLVADRLGLKNVLLRSDDMWQFYSNKDCKGPAKAYAEIGVPATVWPKLASPAERAMLDWFESSVEWDPESPMIQAMLELGKRWISDAKMLVSRLELLARYAERVMVAGQPFMVHEIKGASVQMATRKFRDENPEFRDTVAVLSPDEYGPGWALFRFESGSDAVDFSRLAQTHGVGFVASSGYLAKLGDISRKAALELAAKAVTR